MRTATRRACGVLVIVLTGGLLAGCDPVYQADAPLQLKIEDEAIVVGFCDGTTADKILLEYRPSERSRWKTVLEASGRIGPDSLNTADLGSEVSVHELDLPDVVPGSQVAIVLNSSGQNASISAVWDLPDGVKSAGWINADQSISDAEC